MPTDQAALLQLTQQILAMAQTASADQAVENADLRRLLKFLMRMGQVVEHAFGELYSILLDVKYLKASDLHSERFVQLRRDLDMVFVRSWYRDMAEICSRLHNLGEQYQQQVQPIVGQLAHSDEWADVFAILEENEGYIIRMVQETASDLAHRLSMVETADDLADLRQVATQRAETIRKAVELLQQMNSRILGLSGGTGFLEMTEVDRSGISNELTVMIERADQYITNVNTAGGPYVAGNVQTGGDFVGRDQTSVP